MYITCICQTFNKSGAQVSVELIQNQLLECVFVYVSTSVFSQERNRQKVVIHGAHLHRVKSVYSVDRLYRFMSLLCLYLPCGKQGNLGLL